jgi:hypothetical protein
MRTIKSPVFPDGSIGTPSLGILQAPHSVPGRRYSLLVLIAITCGACLSPAGSASAGSAAAENAVVQKLRQNTQALLDAIAPGNVSVWSRLLDARAIQVDENDVVRNKSEILANLKPLGSGLTGNLEIDDFQVALAGNVAVATHEDKEYLDYHGQVIRSRFRMTDTWIRTHQGWRQIGSQVLAVLQDPPAIPLDSSVLCSYTGRYALTAQIIGTIHCRDGELTFERAGRPDSRFLAETPDVFFEPGAPRSRRIFLRDKDGHVTGFVDRREARDILWTRIDEARMSPP